MATDISVAFIKQYESEVHLAYQNQGTRLRNTVRTKNNIKGESTTFQIIGKGTASTKTRNGTVTPMNLEHSKVEVYLKDYYAGEWIDKMDELKTNIDERKAAAQSGAYALGRQSDKLIIDALSDATNIVGDGTATLSLDLVLEAFATFNAADVPDDGERYGIVTPKMWNALLKIDQFAKSNYVDDKAFMKGTECRKWLGINWMMHTALPVTDSVANGFLYHKSAIGHAIGSDVVSDIQWHNDHAAFFVNNMMSQGAGLIDNSGVVVFKVKEG